MTKFRRGHEKSSRGTGGWMTRLVVFTVLLFFMIIMAFVYFPSLGGSEFSASSYDSSDYQSEDEYALDGSDKTYIDFLPVGGSNNVIHHKYYSLAYNEKHEQADWVMYELTKKSLDAKNVPRAKRFNPDNKVRTKSAVHADYTHSGYTRGHLAPSGDMAFNTTAMKECFLMSNMSPQPRALNNGIWKELEETARDWALNKKELYIVTGPIFTSKNPKQIGRNKVSVPDEFFKIIVDVDTKRNICYRIPNALSNKKLENYVVSINELESDLNMNFFSGFLSENDEDIIETKYWPTNDRKYNARVNRWNKE